MEGTPKRGGRSAGAAAELQEDAVMGSEGSSADRRRARPGGRRELGPGGLAGRRRDRGTLRAQPAGGRQLQRDDAAAGGRRAPGHAAAAAGDDRLLRPQRRAGGARPGGARGDRRAGARAARSLRRGGGAGGALPADGGDRREPRSARSCRRVGPAIRAPRSPRSASRPPTPWPTCTRSTGAASGSRTSAGRRTSSLARCRAGASSSTATATASWPTSSRSPPGWSPTGRPTCRPASCTGTSTSTTASSRSRSGHGWRRSSTGRCRRSATRCSTSASSSASGAPSAPGRWGCPGCRRSAASTGLRQRAELAALYEERSGRSLAHLPYYMALAFWKLAAIVEGAHAHFVAGRTDAPYAAALEHDVPALLAEARWFTEQEE